MRVTKFLQWMTAALACSVLGCSSGGSNDSSTKPIVPGSVSPPAQPSASGSNPGSPTNTVGSQPMTSMPIGNGTMPGNNPPPPSTNGSAGSSATPPPNMPAAGSAAPPAGTAGAASTGMPTPHGGDTCLQAGSGNFGEPGPYKIAMMDVDLGSGGEICPNQTTSKYTIFYPNPLEASCPHPIVAWGNGTGVNSDSLDAYSFFSTNAASWGIVVIAAHDPNSGCGNYHKVGLDYLLKQNEDSSSMFFHKLSTRAGVAGHSQGGMGATAASMHPNVEAEVSVAGGGVPKAGIAFICLTGTMDQVEGPCTQSYMSATGPAFLADWMNGDHTTTETVAGYFAKDMGTLEMQRLYAAWFRCWLGDDQKACALFTGAPASCGICSNAGWAKHEARNM